MKKIRDVEEIINNHPAFDTKGLAKKIHEYYTTILNESTDKSIPDRYILLLKIEELISLLEKEMKNETNAS